MGSTLGGREAEKREIGEHRYGMRWRCNQDPKKGKPRRVWPIGYLGMTQEIIILPTPDWMAVVGAA